MKENVKKSYPILFAQKGYWINSDGVLLDIYNPYDKDRKYLENCIRMMKNQEKGITDIQNK